MGDIFVFIVFIVGLIIIIKGGDWFVDAAVWIAQVTGIPSVLIGATIVSIATTLPELLVSAIATYQSYYDVAIGNVVGSMICNIGLILGLTAILSPVKIKRVNFSIKSFFMLMSCVVLLFLAKDRIITSWEGNLFLLLFMLYIGINILEFRDSHKSTLVVNGSIKIRKGEKVINIGKFLIGGIFITVGARLLVGSGVKIAQIFSVPEQVVSLTMIALGTSLPELTTAVSSVIKKQQGISVGNILGANILNMVMVLGICSKIGERGLVISYQNIMLGPRIYTIPQTLYLDLPVALVMMAILGGFGFMIGKINRTLGLTLLSIYCIYLTVLVKLFL